MIKASNSTPLHPANSYASTVGIRRNNTGLFFSIQHLKSGETIKHPVYMAKYSAELRNTAKNLYIKGWSIPEISKETGITERTLYNWRESENWEMFAAPDTVEQAIARRINVLAERENKNPGELDEMARLTSVFGDLRINIAKSEQLMASARLLDKGGYIPPEILPDAPSQTDLNNAAFKERQPSKKRKKKTVKNDISSITVEMLDNVREKLFFKYQTFWYERKLDPKTCRTRIILKSRQIGATWYFAFEALDDAIRNGDNQLFLSSSRDQAEVFKAYIIAFARDHFEIELKGQGVITLSNGAELRFLSTNSRTANSYHGHLYCDEIFWMPDFKKLWHMASGMASHKKWRRTLFSVPSASSHPAYSMWNGDDYNAKLAESKQVDFDVSHKALKNGQLGEDGYWRQIVTIKDAEQQGCDLFDIDELKRENSTADFNNKYMCKWIDDANSVFSLDKLMNCMVDTDTWKDYHEKAARPFGNRPVALGYDPSRTRDNASLATVGIPLDGKEPWRLLKKESYHGVNFQFQANRIKEKVDAFNVKHIGIDITGIGYGVFELVERFYSRATPINYSVQTKTELVLKALQIIENGQFQYSAGDKEVTQAFMMITQKITPGSGQITYAANRSNTTGHADVAWAIMHAFNYEKIAPRKKTSVVFSQ